MENIKNLMNGNIEQFKNGIESALFAKLSSKLDEVHKDIAQEIYNKDSSNEDVN